MRGDRGREERRTQEWILAQGYNTGTSVNLEQRWSGLSLLRVGLQVELTKVLDAGKNWK